MSADPYWNYVKLLCHFNGIDGSTRVVDERHNPASLGSTLKLSSLQKKFGTTSVYFTNDSTKELYWGASAVTFISGTLDLTLESWVFPLDNAVVNPWVWGFGNSSGMTSQGAALYADSAAAPGKFSFVLAAYHTSTPLLVSTSTIIYEGWTHVAVTRSNNIWRLFVNGVLEASATYAGATINVTTFRVSNPAGPFVGYIDDLRLTVGVCRYTADFTPPTEAFPGSGATDQHYGNVVLHCHFNGENNATTFVDQKGHALSAQGTPPAKIATGTSKFGGSSVAGNADTGTYISAGTHTDYYLGAADFTVECFAFRSVGDTLARICEFRNAAGGEVLSVAVSIAGDGLVRVLVGGATVVTGTGYPLSINAWFHVAVVRNGASIKLFVNGIQAGSSYDIGTSSIDSSGTLYLCGSPSVGWMTYLDEFRFTKGVARYTTAFTPPTDPFPDYALQKLTGAVFDAAGNPVAKTVRSYRTSDGLLIDQSVSSATTGAFELRATDTTEHFVVVHDATKNALVYDHIVPVI